METMRHVGAKVLIEGEHMIFSPYAKDHAGSLGNDYDIKVAELMSLTGRSKAFITSGIDGYSRLRDLPRLRALHEAHKLIDVPRLATIDRTMSVLAPDTGQDTFDLFDELLLDLFIPATRGRPLPSLWRLTSVLRHLVAEVDSSVNFNPVKRRRRENSQVPTARFLPMGDGTAGLSLTADTATIAGIDAFVGETARVHKLGLAETIIKLLTGKLEPETKATIHVYSVSGQAYIPRYGWLGDTVDALFDLTTTPTKTTDLDAIADSQVSGYTPTPSMAAFVHARDGTCVFPGCHVPAERCQLDHRIPYEEGGPTSPANLYALCQHHHNIKTDRRAFYIPDPTTGETIWLFSNGSWALSEEAGILRTQITPTQPRWKTTRDGLRAARARVARFHAACHTLCDTYDTDGNYDACVAAISELEREYDLEFEFTPPAPKTTHGYHPNRTTGNPRTLTRWRPESK